jgi:hypothetical protein
MIRSFIFVLGFCLLILFPPVLFSQASSSCAENLQSAQVLFDRGQVNQVPALLRDCLKSGFNREEELTAFKLLIQSYLFEDKLIQADSAMLVFLRRNPEYELSPTDHSSFVFLFNKFEVRMVAKVSVQIGANLPFVTFVRPDQVSGLPGKNSYSSEASNLYAALSVSFRLAGPAEMNLGAAYSQLNFTNTRTINNYYNVPFTEAIVSESLRRLEIPVSVTYNTGTFGRFTPYARLGTGPSLTLGSSAIAQTDNTDLNNLIDHSGSELEMKDGRISFDIFVQAGAGAKFKTPGGYIFAELQSSLGLLNQTVKGGSADQELGYFYYSGRDDLHLNTLTFSVGYTQIFYKPLKRKE